MAAFTSIALGIAAAAGVAGAVNAASQASEAKKARKSQEAELASAKAIQAEQDKKVSEQTARADAQAQERAARLSSGRKGLLYQGDESGTTNPAATTLGG